MRKYLLITLLLTIAMLAACGRDSYIEEETTIHRLSVFTNANYRQVLYQAAEAMSAVWETAHPNRLFELELSTYTWDNVQYEYERVRTMFAAGQSYDMFVSHRVWLLDFANAGYLLDIYTLIDADPFATPGAAWASRGDFFEQALIAHEIGGRLYTLPLGFGFNYISVNTRMPDTVIDRFTANDTISICELMRMYIDIRNFYEYNYADMYFVANDFRMRWPQHVLSTSINNFINFTGRTTYFASDEFIQFLTYIQDVYSRPVSRHSFAESLYWNPMRCSATTMTYSWHYVFLTDNEHQCPLLALADSRFLFPPLLVYYHAMPLTDSHGRLLLSPGGGMMEHISFPTGRDSALGWEFTQHVILAFSQPQGRALSEAFVRNYGPFSMSSPILRELLAPHVHSVVHRANSQRWVMGLQRQTAQLTYPIPLDCDETMGSMIARLENFNEMPIAPPYTHIPMRLLNEDIDAFVAGSISAEEYARRLEFLILQWWR